ncbi:MAG TPA: fatty acid desaturase [Mycobacterium sp.]
MNVIYARTSAPSGTLPNPEEAVPSLAVPTILLVGGALVSFGVSSWGYIVAGWPTWVVILVNTVACFMMFTGLHEASHHAVSRSRWVNAAIARLSIVWVMPWTTGAIFSYVHIEHHRNTGEPADAVEPDPQHYNITGPWWQLPARWATADLVFLGFYFGKMRQRPVREIVEQVIVMSLFTTLIVATALTGTIGTLAIVYLIPLGLSAFFVSWLFDWLPHHGLDATQRQNRYRATRNRVGLEWLLTPVFLFQNYHLIHHLHPSIPFYRYTKAWQKNENAYLERNAAMKRVIGRDLTPEEYRVWRGLESQLSTVDIRDTTTADNPATTTDLRFHRLAVAQIDRLATDSVAVMFDVPEPLSEQFRFEAGQHVTVRADIGGQIVRRTYSICTQAPKGSLRIAIKHVDQGVFSTFATEQLTVGDELDVMTPAGRFGPTISPNQTRRYAMIAAGSGITPVLSILKTILAVESESRCTLVFGNRDVDSTIFRDELQALEADFVDRFEIVEVFSAERRRGLSPYHGRIDSTLLRRLFAARLPMQTVDQWLLCGPAGLVESVTQTLAAEGVDDDCVHVERFTVVATSAAENAVGTSESVATVRLRGRVDTVRVGAGETVLDACIREVSTEMPYSCMGGACGTCVAKLTAGTVQMDNHTALSAQDRADSYILTCQSRPTSATVSIDYDQR